MNKTVNPFSREFGLAQKLAARGKDEQAIEIYDELLEIDPEFAAGLAYRGQTLHHTGQLDEAAASLCRAIELEPERFAWYTMLAGIECARGDLESARDAARSAVELKPGNSLARAYLSLASAGLGQWQTAIEELHEMELPCQPDFQAAAYMMVERKLATHKSQPSPPAENEQAGVPSKSALAYVPLVRSIVATLYLRRAERAANTDRYAHAIELATRAYSLVPNRFGVDEFMAELYLLADDPGRAEVHIKKAEARRSEDPVVLYIRGRLELARNRPTRAVDALEQSIELDRELEDAYYWLGRANLAADRPDRARLYFRQFAFRDARHLRSRIELLRKLLAEKHESVQTTGPAEGRDEHAVE